MGAAMSCKYLEQCIKPGTSQVLINWYLFTDRHHNGGFTHEETVKKYKGTVMGEDIDFDKMDKLIEEENMKQKADIIPNGDYPPHAFARQAVNDLKSIQERIESRRVTITFGDQEVSKLFNLLEKYKDEAPDIHEIVYQAMTNELISRINQG